MDHCHILEHAAGRMIAHLAYQGVDSPGLLGSKSGNESGITRRLDGAATPRSRQLVGAVRYR